MLFGKTGNGFYRRIFGGFVPNWREANVSYADAYRNIDFEHNPELYKIGKGEQGVLIAEPYKSRILEIGWRFKTPEVAEESSANILAEFYRYLNDEDFIGADMCRKFLMMGWTRARRYSNHRSGKKYDQDMNVLPQESDALTSEKARSAAIFRSRYLTAEHDARYRKMRDNHRSLHE